MKVLVTGAAGFIGSHTSIRLLERGDSVVGIDNLNDYYDPQLKLDRLEYIKGKGGDFTFIKMDLADRPALETLFSEEKFDRVVHLGAQAGVRYSIDNPNAYVDSNLVGFANILEGCRHNQVEHLVYASSSSVYGANESMPFSIGDNVDHPLSLYAATKKSNELMAHTYSSLYNLPCTGLRFFTVYGPWGRPDMAPWKFVERISEDRPIQVYNYGNHQRDFTYIDDIVEGVIRTLDKVAASDSDWSAESPNPSTSRAPWRIYNIGNQQPVELMDFIGAIEEALGKEAEKEMLPMQPGDVQATYADVEALVADVGYKPAMDIRQGMANFVAWYHDYHRKQEKG